MFFIMLLNMRVAFAAVDCNTIPLDEDIPAEYLVCPFKRVFNAAILLAGVLLTIMILVGVIKMSLAMGNPEGLKAASANWTYVIYGFLVIVGFAAIYSIIVTSLGLSYFSTFSEVFDAAATKLEELVTAYTSK